jgi:hypothetical protein
MPVTVKGETTILWELQFMEEDGEAYDVAELSRKAKEYLQDMLDLQGMGGTAAFIVSQDDRVLTIHPREWEGIS